MHYRTLLIALFCGGAGWAQTPTAPTITPGQTLPPQTMPGQTTPGITPPSGMPANVPNTNVVDDSKFARDATEEGLLQVELGKLAAQKALAPEVKELAQKLQDDHTAANSQLKDAAGKLSIEVPSALDSKHQSKLRKMAKLSGPRFDRAYIDSELDDHESDIKHYSAEKDRGTAPEVMAFAAAALPKLQEHLEMIKALKKSAKSK